MDDTYKKPNAILFFPSPGFGEMNEYHNFSNVGDFGCYWTNCIKEGDRRNAYAFRLCGNNSYNQDAAKYYNVNGDYTRWKALPIRAVAPIPAE